MPSDEDQVGFVAQEVQQIFPEAFQEGADGYLEFNMHAIHIALLNAVKELGAEIDRLKSENAQLRSDNETAKVDAEELNSRLENIESILSAVLKNDYRFLRISIAVIYPL